MTNKDIHTTTYSKNDEVEKTLKCQNCGYVWTYKGQNPYYATCSRCKSSINIKKQQGGKKE